MIFHVTAQCNAHCKMCFNHALLSKMQNTSPLSLYEIRSFVQNLSCLPQLTFSGGEPLLRDDLAEIIKLFYRKAGTRFFSVPTNALSPDKVEDLINSFTAQCENGFLNFCIPFHGEADLYDEILGVTGAFDKLKETYRVICRSKRSHPNISCLLACVVTKDNYQRLNRIFDLADREFTEFPVGLAFCRGTPREPETAEFPVEAYYASYQTYFQRRKMKSRKNPYTIMFEAIGRQFCEIVTAVAKGDMKNLNCRAGRNIITVYPDGSVYPCELTDQIGTCSTNVCLDSYLMGNLKNYDFDLPALLNNPDADRIRNWIQHTDCACTWECAIYNKIMHSPHQIITLGKHVCQYAFQSIKAR